MTAFERADATELTPLVYELLDAHHDTAQLASELPADPRWDAHLQYLRALQRAARELLAHQPTQRTHLEPFNR